MRPRSAGNVKVFAEKFEEDLEASAGALLPETADRRSDRSARGRRWNEAARGVGSRPPLVR